jgi:hypothetical protein
MNLFSYKKLIFFERATVNSCVDISRKNFSILFLSLPEFKSCSFYNSEFQAQYEERYLKGHTPAALWYNGQIVNISWIAKSPLFINEIKKEYKADKNKIIIFDVITKTEERGKGFYAVMLEMINRWALDNGYSQSIIYSESKNLPSIKGIMKAGYKKKETIIFIEIIGKNFYFSAKNQE